MRGGLALLLAVLTGASAVAVAASPAPAAARERTVCLRRPTLPPAARCAESPLVEFDASVSPRLLSARTPAPIGVRLEAVVRTAGGSLPPAAREVTFDFDKGGSLDADGLPTCSAQRLEKLGAVDARRECRGAIVGSGRAELAIGAAGTEALDLTLFNGGSRAGTTTVLVDAAGQGGLGPTRLVTPMKVRRQQGSGPYGWEATVAVPPIPGGETSTLLGFELNVRRLFSHRGQRQSYLTARCPLGRLQMALGIRFRDGTRFLGTAVRPCRPPLE